MKQITLALCLTAALCSSALAQAVGVAPAPAPAIIETGTLAGQVLTWVITVAGTALSIVLTGLLVRLFQRMGVQITDAARARLQEIILNGLTVGAKEAATQLEGRGKIAIKQAAVASTVRYVQAHGGDTIRQLGLDPTSPAAIETIKARIERAIADPTIPTPPVLDDKGPPAPAEPLRTTLRRTE